MRLDSIEGYLKLARLRTMAMPIILLRVSKSPEVKAPTIAGKPLNGHTESNQLNFLIRQL